MDFLQGSEVVRLQAILEKHPAISDAAMRPSILKLCKLEDALYFLDTQGSSNKFVTLLLAECSEVNFVNKEGNHALVALLSYLYRDSLPAHQCKMTKGERIFIKDVIQRCEQWQRTAASPQGLNGMIDAAITDNEQAIIFPSPSPARSIRFDKNTIIGYDLDVLIGDFGGRMELGQVSAFSLSGEYDMLKEYVLERMYQKLEYKTRSRLYQTLEININAQNVKHETIIKDMLLQKYKCQGQQLAELLSKYPDQDIVLLIWNYGPIIKPLKTALSYLWSELQRDIAGLLKEPGLCFVVVHAHIGQNERSGSIENFTRLCLERKHFTRTALEPWLNFTLHALRVENDDLRYCLDLLYQDATPIENYRQLGYMVEYLQGRHVV